MDELLKLETLKSFEISDKSELEKLYSSRFLDEKIVHIFLRAFHKSQGHLVERPFGKRPRENYIRSIDTKLTDTTEYRKYMTYLSLTDLDKFMKIIADIKSEFAQETEFEFNQILDTTLMKLMEEDDLHEAVEEKENIEEPEEKIEIKGIEIIYYIFQYNN